MVKASTSYWHIFLTHSFPLSMNCTLVLIFLCFLAEIFDTVILLSASLSSYIHNTCFIHVNFPSYPIYSHCLSVSTPPHLSCMKPLHHSTMNSFSLTRYIKPLSIHSITLKPHCFHHLHPSNNSFILPTSYISTPFMSC